jgi:hypothetical protein
MEYLKKKKNKRTSIEKKARLGERKSQRSSE